MADNKVNMKNELKENILKWYPFEQNASVLKIEKSIDNIEEKQYDYVILLGTLEYAHKLFQEENPEEQLIEHVKKYLKDTGKLLIITNNKIGMETFCKIEKDEERYRKLNINSIKALLEKTNMKYQKNYYVLPNYETANVIFSDEFLPNMETVTRDITLYNEGDISVKSQRSSFMKLIEQDIELFKVFANTYFIECSMQEFKNNGIKFVSFSNIRKPEYAIVTMIKDNKVYKTARNDKALQHIENVKENINTLNKIGIKLLDSYNEDAIISEYQNDKQTLDNIIMNKIKEKKKEEAVELIKKFFNEIKTKLTIETVEKNIFDKYEIEYKKEEIEGLSFTKYGFWDLIFQNAFYINDEFYFYDQEWKEEEIPIEYILYRSIEYTKGLKEKLDMEKVWKDIGIEKENIKLFKKLDDKLQEKIRDYNIWQWHSKEKRTVETMQEEIEKLKQDKQEITKDCQKLLNEKDARIKFLEDNMQETADIVRKQASELAEIKATRLWRLSEKIKHIKKRGEKNEN